MKTEFEATVRLHQTKRPIGKIQSVNLVQYVGQKVKITIETTVENPTQEPQINEQKGEEQ